MQNARIYLIVTSQFNGENASVDVNGKSPVYLKALNGTLPQRARVLSGTVAENSGFEPGNTYLVEVEYTGDGDYGPQFQHTLIGKPSVMEIIEARQKLPSINNWNPGYVREEVEEFVTNDIEAEVAEEESL